MQHANNFLELVEQYKPLVKEVDIDFIKQRLDNKEQMVLIDVREDSEWSQGHISGAIHLSKGVIERDIINKGIKHDELVVLYCAGGYRSILSAYSLQQMGYTNVASLSGGVRDWLNAGYKLSL